MVHWLGRPLTCGRGLKRTGRRPAVDLPGRPLTCGRGLKPEINDGNRWRRGVARSRAGVD